MAARRLMAVGVGLAVLVAGLGGPPQAAAGAGVGPSVSERVSVASNGAQAVGRSEDAAVSADGRFVAFESTAANLVGSDTNGVGDVFIRDRHTGATERVSVATGGVEANAAATDPALSADGRFVAFVSSASNLVGVDTNGVADVFVRDRQAVTTERISVGAGGVQATSLSDGPSISADGRFVAFRSSASNLVPDDLNGAGDVFVRDRLEGTTELVSVSSDETQGTNPSHTASISGDGRFVGFFSTSNGLVPNDTNGAGDVFVRDRQAGTTERVSVSTAGVQGNGTSNFASLSGDGRFVAFRSGANNLVPNDTNVVGDVFVRDRQSQTTERVSVASNGVEGDNQSEPPATSADGRFVAFASFSSNLVGDDDNDVFDVFVRDRQWGTTQRVSVAAGGMEANGPSELPSISGDGRFVVFESDATNLVVGDTNGERDVFGSDRGTGFLRVTTAPAVPGQVIVDGVVRDSWGLNWAEFGAGDHEVCFGPVPGFTPPPCEEIEIVPGETTTVQGVYAQRGTLRVLTSPALPATITIDGAPANDWGVWTDLDPGSYQVCFGPVAGYTAPPCQMANVTAGATATITGVFTSAPGAPGPSGHGFLRVTTAPAVASRILVDGNVADTWGLTWLKLAPGFHDVCFEGLLYVSPPACEEVLILAGTTTVVQGDFVVHGFLKVNTSPAVGATIWVDGRPANAWGVWTSLEPGTYEVCFGSDPFGLTPPPCQDAVVSSGATTELTGTYS